MEIRVVLGNVGTMDRGCGEGAGGSVIPQVSGGVLGQYGVSEPVVQIKQG